MKKALGFAAIVNVLLASLAPSAAFACAQESSAWFDAPVLVGGPFERFEALEDLDKDGDLDLIGIWLRDGAGVELGLRARFNDGQGRFLPGFEFFAPLPSSGLPRLEVVQLDADGLPDFALWSGDSIELFRGQGQAVPLPFGSIALSTGPKDVLFLDVDGDGRDDLITNGSTGQVWINPGAGVWSGPTSTFPLNVTPALVRFTAAEVNGDSQLDVCFEGVIAGPFQTDLRAVQLRPIVGGQVQAGQVLALPEQIGAVRGFAPGDVDQDGDADLVCFLETGNYVLYRRLGPQAWQVGTPTGGGPADRLIDFDGDGDLDGVGLLASPNTGPLNGNSCRFQIALGDGTGAFAPAHPIDALGAVRLAGAADVDQDGDVDLVAGRSLWYAQSAGQLPWNRSLPAWPGKPIQLAPIDLGDGDRDQDTDLAIAPGLFLQSDGSGLFQVVSKALPQNPPGIFSLSGPGLPGDFDGDGDTDLLVSAWSNLFNFAHLRLLRNNGAGVLSDAGQAAPTGFEAFPGGTLAGQGPTTQFAFRGDLDGDGDLDLAVRQAFTALGAPARLLFNSGSGVFDASQSTPLSQVDACLDLDGDGLLDLLGRIASGWWLQRGISPGKFRAPELLVDALNTFKSFDRALPIDFDGDSDLDLVLQVGNRLALLRQGPAGSFAADLAIFDSDPASAAPLRLASDFSVARHHAVADLDADGRAEFIVGPLEGGTFGSLILSFDGQGGFEVRAQALLASLTDDLDGDGDLDLIGNALVASRRFPNPGSGERQQYGQVAFVFGSQPPVLGASGPLRVGETLGLSVSGLTPGTFGLLTLAASPSLLVNVPAPGLTAQAWPPLALVDLPLASGPGLLAGDGRSAAQFPVGPNWPNLGDLYLQAFFIEPSAPALLVASNGLRLRFAQ
jgi:hypothetical protein